MCRYKQFLPVNKQSLSLQIINTVLVKSFERTKVWNALLEGTPIFSSSFFGFSIKAQRFLSGRGSRSPSKCCVCAHRADWTVDANTHTGTLTETVLQRNIKRLRNGETSSLSFHLTKSFFIHIFFFFYIYLIPHFLSHDHLPSLIFCPKCVGAGAAVSVWLHKGVLFLSADDWQAVAVFIARISCSYPRRGNKSRRCFPLNTDWRSLMVVCAFLEGSEMPPDQCWGRNRAVLAAGLMWRCSWGAAVRVAKHRRWASDGLLMSRRLLPPSDEPAVDWELPGSYREGEE